MMRASVQLGLFTGITMLACWLGGCSSGGFLEPPKESGIIQMKLVGPGTSLSANGMLTDPLGVAGMFSVQLSEQNYNATFTALIDSYTAPVAASCYVVNMDATGKIALFSLRTPAPSPVPMSSANPCAQPGADVENAVFLDQQGHNQTLYFTNMLATPAPSATIGADFYGTVTALSTSSPSPSLVSNAFVLAVTESNYTGPFTGRIESYTAATSAPCYQVTMDATGKIATIAPNSSANVCTPPNTDVESVQFEDSHGNSSSLMYFENAGSAPNGPLEALQGFGTLNTTYASPLTIGTFLPALTITMSSPVSVVNPTPYSATVVSHSMPGGPCLAPAAAVGSRIQITVPSPVSPCVSGSGEVEGVLFSDTAGNTSEQFFKF